MPPPIQHLPNICLHAPLLHLPPTAAAAGGGQGGQRRGWLTAFPAGHATSSWIKLVGPKLVAEGGQGVDTEALKHGCTQLVRGLSSGRTAHDGARAVAHRRPARLTLQVRPSRQRQAVVRPLERESSIYRQLLGILQGDGALSLATATPTQHAAQLADTSRQCGQVDTCWQAVWG